MEQIGEKEREIECIKTNLPLEINENEKMTVTFLNGKQDINYNITCKEKQIFNTLENLLYIKYPNYRENENFFICNGNIVKKAKTLKENNIKDGDVIILNKQYA